MPNINTLESITPIDGRYRKDAAALAPYSSESTLSRKRLEIEVEYLSTLHGLGIVTFDTSEIEALRDSYRNFSLDDAQLIKDIEVKGVPGINNGMKTEHDVKAIELFMKYKFAGTSMGDRLEFIHFNLTSEDVNNIAYACLLNGGTRNVLLPSLLSLGEQLTASALANKSLVMPGRTHGQYAIPTTVGKEFLVFANRVVESTEKISKAELKGKLNGAIGNYSSFVATHPTINWECVAKDFVTSFGLEFNPITTQIEPHDGMVRLFDEIRHANSILIGFDQDMWGYISDNYIAQKPKDGEIGSSTMPQKVNPIKFENSEANLTMANALLQAFSTKLLVSRFQRDLSDSATLRWIGTALAASVIGYNNTTRGLERCIPNEAVLAAEIDGHWEMLAEPVQQILRREQVSGAYDMLKSLTRGHGWSRDALYTFAATAPVSDSVRDEIRRLSPQSYTGLATTLVEREVPEIVERLCAVKHYKELSRR